MCIALESLSTPCAIALQRVPRPRALHVLHSPRFMAFHFWLASVIVHSRKKRRASGALGAPRARAPGARGSGIAGGEILRTYLTRPAAATGRPARVDEPPLCEARSGERRDSAVVVVRVARHDVHEVVGSHPARAAAVSLGDHLPHLVVRDLLADLRGSK
eukprot:scaffold74646_cov66-Phaeocystis_antarctica.AAC.2